MKPLIKYFFYIVLLLSCNYKIYSQIQITNYKMISLNEKYYKEIKTKAYKLNEKLFLKEKGFEYDEKNNINYVKLYFLSEKNNYLEKGLKEKINGYESYESPSFLLFESEKFRNKVFIWKIEGEYFSRVFIYNVDSDINFLGEITIGKFCEPNCDAFNLANSDIVVKRDKISVEIIFKGKIFYSTPKIIQSKRGGRIIADNLILSYFISDL